MTLTAARKTDYRDDKCFSVPLAANAQVYQGGLVMRDAGKGKAAAPGADATVAAALVVVGLAQKTVRGGPTDGEVRAPVERGCYLLKNSAGGDAITDADIGKAAYVVDDETVAKTSNTNVRPRAGTIVDVESAGVWVRVGV